MMGSGGGDQAGIAQTEQIPPALFNQAAGNSLFDINATAPGQPESGGSIFSGNYNPYPNVSIGQGSNNSPFGSGAVSGGGTGVYGGGAATGGNQTFGATPSGNG